MITPADTSSVDTGIAEGVTEGDTSGVTLPLQSLIDQRHVQLSARLGTPKGLGPWMGPFRGPRHGHGLDFDELRIYADGDDVRHIDWKVTARRNAAHTRLYREEKENVITFALDFRGSLFTGSQALRAVKAGTLAARMFWQAAATGNRCGLQILTDNDIIAMPAGSGDRAALHACRMIASEFASQASAPASASELTLSHLAERLLGGGRLLGSIIMITGLDDDSQSYALPLAALATSRPVSIVLIEDELETQQLPPGNYHYLGNKGRQSVYLNQTLAAEVMEQLQHQLTSIKDVCQQANVALIKSGDGDQSVQAALHRLGFLS